MKKNCDWKNYFQSGRLKLLLLPLKFTVIVSFLLIIGSTVEGFSRSNSRAEMVQKKKISGLVTDAITNETLIGVTVLVDGTSIGTITDSEGRYTIECPSSAVTVSFSFIGYLSEHVAISGQSTIDVKLVSDIKKLDEIVVVGYGTVKKSDISGSVASVSQEELIKKNPSNILQGLKGAAAGVMVTSQDGAPDGNAAIRIRGVATINGDAKPIYVVDGVQVGTDANFINPGDVESIEVLKDASATAIYGSVGANGVIMITTKHGKAGATHITFSADYGVQTLASKLDVGNIDQYAKDIRTARANDGGSLANQVFAETYDGKRKNIDWQKEMTRVSLKQQYALSATGGTEKTQSNLSLSYLNNDGIVINTNYSRITARANVVTKVAEFIELGGDINFIHTQSHGSNGTLNNNGNLSSQRDMAYTCPTMDYVDQVGNYVSPNVKNPNGTYGTTFQSTSGNYDGGTVDNMVALQMENNGLTRTNQTFVSAYANIQLFKGLTFKTIGSYNFYAKDFQTFYGNKLRYLPDGTQVVIANYDTRYTLNINSNQNTNLALESYLTYNWKNDIHNLTLMAGNSVTSGFGDYVNGAASQFPGSNIRDISLSSEPATEVSTGAYNTPSRSISYYARASYVLKDRYILTGTVRRDGSSNFGIGNTFGTFPSLAAAWKISEENFLKGNPTISNLKLRFGWGKTGNAGNIGDKAVASLTSSTIAYYTYPQNGVAGLSTNLQTNVGTVRNLVDPNLKWETNVQNNFGIDMGLFKNSVNITVDYFTRKATDMLLYQQIRPSAGYTQVYTNYGEIQNSGIEFSVNYKKIINQDWNFSATLTGSSLKNKVIKMGVDLLNDDESLTNTVNDGSDVGPIGSASGVHWGGASLCREGYAVGSYYGYQVEGVFQSKTEVDAANALAVSKGHLQYQEAATQAGDFKYKDVNGDGFIDDKDMVILGNGFPKVNFGLTLNASYKNWDISVYSYGVLGQKLNSYSAMMMSNMFPSDNNTAANLLKSASAEAWTPENHSNTLSRLSILDLNKNMRASSAWVKNGDFLKINSVQIGYNLDKKLLKPLHLESTRLNFAIQNLVCFSSYNKYGDPEVGHGNVLYTGLDTGRYPNPRTYTLGLNIQF